MYVRIKMYILNQQQLYKKGFMTDDRLNYNDEFKTKGFRLRAEP